MRYTTREEFYEEHGFDVDDLPDITEQDIQELKLLIASLYRTVCEDGRLEVIEKLWEMSEEWTDLQPFFRRVHDDPTFAPRLDRK